MAKKLFVGSLPYSATSDQLRELFEKFGTVTSADVIMDRHSGRSKGFGFVEFENDADADKAVAELNGKDYEGRALTVNEARPKEDRPQGSFGGGGGGGGAAPAPSTDDSVTPPPADDSQPTE